MRVKVSGTDIAQDPAILCRNVGEHAGSICYRPNRSRDIPDVLVDRFHRKAVARQLHGCTRPLTIACERRWWSERKLFFSGT